MIFLIQFLSTQLLRGFAKTFTGNVTINKLKGVIAMSKDQGLSDKVKGKVNQAKGEVKDQVGNATDNPNLQREGKKDKLKGNIQEGVGKAKDDSHRY